MHALQNAKLAGWQHPYRVHACCVPLHVEEERAFNELLEQERKQAEESSEIEELRREYAKLRQRNARLCRKYGLKGKAER